MRLPSVLAVSALVVQFARGQAGYLDPTFGMNGISSIAPSTGNVAGASIALSADGRPLVLGTASHNGVMKYVVVGYTMDGALDTSFGAGGCAFVGFNSPTNHAEAIAVQADQRILITGSGGNYGAQNICTARLLPNGLLDQTFGVNGKVSTSIGPGIDVGMAIAVDLLGKVLVAGSTHTGDTSDIVLLRYTTHGELDSTFGINGMTRVDIGHADFTTAMSILPDGHILVAGHTADTAFEHHGVVMRFTPMGELDMSFSEDGLFHCPPDLQLVNALDVSSNGDIVCGGGLYDGSDWAFGVMRLRWDGAIDLTFGVSGLAQVAFGPAMDLLTDLRSDAEGRILLAGRSYNGLWFHLVMARLDTFGQLDPGFGANGRSEPEIEVTASSKVALVIDPAGRILVSGASNYDLIAARSEGTGQLSLTDKSHGTTDILISPNPATDHVTVELLGALEDVQPFYLQSIQGQMIAMVQLRSNCPERIDLSGLPQGAYFLRTPTEKGICMRMLKQ